MTLPTVERFHTTVTERAGFRTCRRRWHLDTVQRLAPKDQVTWYLIFGDCVHAALDVYYRNGRDLKKAHAAFKRAWKKEDTLLRSKFGAFYSMGIEDEWLMHKERGIEMLRCYDMFDREDPFFDQVVDIAIEERAFIDILDLDGEPQPDLPLLSGRIDLVVKTKNGDVWIVDHKALASAPTDTALDIDDQLTGYCYIYWRLTGVMPRGALYNVLIKDPPKPPRLLKDGSLSKAKDQRTTYDLYIQALREIGEEGNPDYDEILTFLQASGWRRFFVRIGSERNMEQLASFEEHLFRETRDMKICLEDETEAYPSPSQYTCPGCSVMPICKAMEEQGDVEWVVNHGFRVQDPRTKIPKGV